MLDLSNLQPAQGSRRKPHRIGRGSASGSGKTSGKGSKGQKARAGASISPRFEAGQMPIYRRLPKRGFKNRFAQKYTVVNIEDLLGFAKGSTVDVVALKEAGKIKSVKEKVKLLSDGDIKVSLVVKLHKGSKAAIEKIEKAGGKFEAVGEVK